MDYNLFPTLNASLNGLAGIFLVLGWRAVKRGDKDTHKKFMISAFCTSVLFLISYLTYHTLHPGVTKYPHQGISRVIYFFILLTHTPLAAIVPIFAVIALWHARRNEFKKHTQITKWLLPVWIYVSTTGVVIYLMLYVL